MHAHTPHTLLKAAVIAVLAASALAPVAGAASAGQTIRVSADHAYVDNKAPGRFFIGTVFKDDSFKIDRTARVSRGEAKGLWYHGTATIHETDAKGVRRRYGKTFNLTGWIKATAFS